MKRIYKNNDLAFNLTINNFPINKELINSIEFKFYTLNPSNYIVKSQDDIDLYNQVILQWDELKKLEEGVLYYDYTVSLNNESMNDGTEDTVTKKMTNYYIVTGIDNINIDNDIDATQYYTKDEVDELINDVVVGTIDLTEYYNKTEVDALISNIEHPKTDLTNYYKKNEVDYKLEGYVKNDVLGSYYTKNEVNDLLDNIEIPTTDLTNYYKKAETYSKSEVNQLIDGLSTGDGEINLNNYYTKDEVNNLIPTDYIKEIPSEYITESELTAKGYLTEHQSLENYYTKSEVGDLINNIEIPTGGTNVDMSNYYTKEEIDVVMLDNHLSDIFSSGNKLIGANISGNWRNEVNFKTVNGESIFGEGNIDIPTGETNVDMSDYYTKTEVNNLIPTDYAKDNHTHTEYLTEHQSLENYYTKTEVDNLIDGLSTGGTNVDLSEYYTKDEIDEKIPSDYIKAVNIGRNDDENFQVEDGVVNIYTEFYDGGYDMNIDSRSVFGIKPMDNTITLENVGGTGNGNFRCGIKINDNVINRITTLETELNGVLEQITELNGMIV